MKPATRHRLTDAILLAVTVLLALTVLALIALVRPYNAIRYSDGDATVTPTTINAGGSLQLRRDEYCNDGYDITVTRWADRLAADGTVTASLSLPPVQFFTEVPLCLTPSVQTVVVPDYIVAINGQPTRYRLRFVTTYRPNLIRTVTVTTFSKPFTITP